MLTERRHPTRVTRAGALTAAPAPLALMLGAITAALTFAGCAHTAAYQSLQTAMKGEIAARDHRPVSSVACTPHVYGTVREETRHLRCLVRFADGTSYTAAAIIQNENSGGRHNVPDTYTWDAPPPAR